VYSVTTVSIGGKVLDNDIGLHKLEASTHRSTITQASNVFAPCDLHLLTYKWVSRTHGGRCLHQVWWP